jgi:thiol-disulfide isomerase/thioredoxin
MKMLAMTIAAAALFGSGCGSGDSRGATVPRDSTSSPAGRAPGGGSEPGGGRLRSLPPQLDFRGTTLDGRPFLGADLAERPVVFWFWAPRCAACISDGQHVAKVAARYGERVAFVGIAGLGGSGDLLRRFVARTGTGGITQLDDRTGRLYAHFAVTRHSSFLFMTRAGRTTRDSGPLARAALERHVRRLAGG